MSSISPGWYTDPADPSTQRYWDGEGWLGAPLPADETPPPGPPPIAISPAAPPTPPTAEQVATALPPEPVPTGGPTSPPGGPTSPPTGPIGSPVGTARGPAPPPVRNAPPGWAYPANGYALPAPPPRPHGLALASLGARLVARLIDFCAVLALNAVVNGWFIWQYVIEVTPYFRELGRRLGTPNPNLEDMQQDSPRAGYLLMVIIILAAALWFAYEVPAVANTGQTLGKRLCGVRVVSLDSPDQLGFGRSMRRWNTLGLPTLLWTCVGLGFVLQFVDCLYATVDRPLHQALHDKSARTVVVHVRGTVIASDTSPAGLTSDPEAADRPTPDGTDQPGGTS